MRAYELRCHCEHLLERPNSACRVGVILADLRDDPFAHLHGHPLMLAGDEHARHQQDQPESFRHPEPPRFGCVPLSLPFRANVMVQALRQKNPAEIVPQGLISLCPLPSSRSQSHWGSVSEKEYTA